jgi:hypothetical protein
MLGFGVAAATGFAGADVVTGAGFAGSGFANGAGAVSAADAPFPEGIFFVVLAIVFRTSWSV